MTSGRPSPSKSSTPTPCGLVPPTPVLGAMRRPESALTSVKRGFVGGAASPRGANAPASGRTKRSGRRTVGPRSLLRLAAVEQRDRLRVAEQHLGAARLDVAADQVDQLDLVAERVRLRGADAAVE